MATHHSLTTIAGWWSAERSWKPPYGGSAADLVAERRCIGADGAAVDAGLERLEEHAGFVRAGWNGVQVLDTDGLAFARMNERISRDGACSSTPTVILNRAVTSTDGPWRALDGRVVLAAKTDAAIDHRLLGAEPTRPDPTARPRLAGTTRTGANSTG